ncbi:transcription initiation factor TFIID subunit 8 [Rhineura floridana]|uniref:transcription initiation factor TFIID subunit 8 n=1 Tax=Rhineura floridana TaxID=261503 RepID=UPI002AC808BD|nr:transcription initiation factor TFIID subunit 8 [Rhineura floridana]
MLKNNNKAPHLSHCWAKRLTFLKTDTYCRTSKCLPEMFYCSGCFHLSGAFRVSSRPGGCFLCHYRIPSSTQDKHTHPALHHRELQVPQYSSQRRMLAFSHGAKMADTGTGGSSSSGTRSGGKHSSTPADNYHLARRRTLQVVVSSLLTEAGFESAEKAAVETMTEMLQSYISEIGRSAKSFCEHTARTQPTLSDIVVTLVEMGFNVETLPAYAKRSQRMVITAPPVTNQPVTPKALTAGQNKPHPSHIPGHFPEFPDPHTYIKTPTYREPVLDYQILREKAASQRRDVERALTRFMAKTGETQSLFKDDVSTFPLIAARPFAIPYLTALLPSELEMQQMEETDSSEQDDQTDTENLPLHDDSGAEKENASVLQHNTSLSGSRNGEENLIDNPYLRPVKKPKIRRKK